MFTFHQGLFSDTSTTPSIASSPFPSLKDGTTQLTFSITSIGFPLALLLSWQPWAESTLRNFQTEQKLCCCTGSIMKPK